MKAKTKNNKGNNRPDASTLSTQPDSSLDEPATWGHRSNPAEWSANDPTITRWKYYYEHERPKFRPFKAPDGWTEEDDYREYDEIWGQCDDYVGDTEQILSKNVAELNDVLDSGIAYFLSRSPEDDKPLFIVSLEDKVALFAELLPESASQEYILRFSISLAEILWLESERRRLGQHKQRWLFPYYQLADSFAAVAFELKESLECEHKDFPAS